MSNLENVKDKVIDGGVIYTGEMGAGKPEGFGHYKWPNGDYYEGEFKNGKRDGKGNYYLFRQESQC
jgi:hypothetical protein